MFRDTLQAGILREKMTHPIRGIDGLDKRDYRVKAFIVKHSSHAAPECD
jgi:hypothetical protein